jgi:hypothetical protein
MKHVSQRLCVLAIIGAAPGVEAANEPQSTSQPMSFEDCLQAIRQTASQLGIAPLNVVETNILRMVRFCSEDGSVLVTCSEPDQKMVVTRSPHRPGCG